LEEALEKVEDRIRSRMRDEVFDVSLVLGDHLEEKLRCRKTLRQVQESLLGAEPCSPDDGLGDNR
jgi:hypothetical protein